MKKNTRLIAILVMTLATLLWGSSFIATKYVTSAVPTALLIAFRMILGGLSLVIIYHKKLKNINKRAIFEGVILGAFYCAGMILQTMGVKYTEAGRSAFLTSAYCVLMPFLEALILKNKVQFKNLLSSIVCFIGVGLVALTTSFTIDGGDLYTLFGSVSFAMSIVLLSYFMRKDDGILLNTILLLSAGIMALIISLFTETMPTSLDTTAIIAALYLAIACSGIPLAFQAIAQKELSPTVISIILGFEAVFASILSAIIYKETFTLRCLIGFVLIFASVFISVIEFKGKEK